MLCSVIIGLGFTPLLGVVADKLSPQLTNPAYFLIRATGIALFYFIKDPTHAYAYCVGAFLILATSFEMIATDSVIQRNA